MMNAFVEDEDAAADAVPDPGATIPDLQIGAGAFNPKGLTQLSIDLGSVDVSGDEGNKNNDDDSGNISKSRKSRW